MNAILHKTGEQFILKSETGETIAITMTEAPQKEGVFLSIKNCQAIENGYDLDDLAEDSVESCVNIYGEKIESGASELNQRKGFKKGFEKALEMNEGKLFTIPQVLKLCTDYYKIGATEVGMPKEKRAILPKEILEDMQKLHWASWDVEIVQVPAKDDCGPGETNWMNPKLDKEGKLILKRRKHDH